MKRQRYGVRVQVSLPKQLARLLDEAVLRDGRSRSEFIRTAVINAIVQVATASATAPTTAPKT